MCSRTTWETYLQVRDGALGDAPSLSLLIFGFEYHNQILFLSRFKDEVIGEVWNVSRPTLHNSCKWMCFNHATADVGVVDNEHAPHTTGKQCMNGRFIFLSY